jgi:hypothetical protein
MPYIGMRIVRQVSKLNEQEQVFGWCFALILSSLVSDVYCGVIES